jgi:hypothetical protein
MSNNWDEIANEAGQTTDEQFKSRISSLTRLQDSEIDTLINETGISQQNLVEVIKAVKDATQSNNAKAAAIQNISKGVEVIVGLAAKFI